MPNTEVKLCGAEDTWRETARENREMPLLNQYGRVSSLPISVFLNPASELYSSLAQLVEHAAVNRRVVGSSPTGGANWFGQIGIPYLPWTFSYGPLAQLVRATGS